MTSPDTSSEQLGRTVESGSELLARRDVFVSETLAPDRHPVFVYLASLAPGSRRTMRTALRVVAAIVAPDLDEAALPFWRLDYQHVAAVRTRLAETFAPSTANRMLAALRGVLRSAFRLGLMSAEQLARACDVDPIVGSRVPKGRSLPAGEVRALFDTCDARKPGGGRNAALLALLYGCGLRRFEVVAIDLEHYDPTDGRLVVRGKGNRERIVYLGDGARAAIAAWLAFRGDEPGPLLYPVTKGGTIERRRMSDAAVAELVGRLAPRANVPRFSPHDMRRTFIGDLLDGGADLATAQALAGHSSPKTTSAYDRRGDRAKKRAAELLHVPFVPPNQ